MHEEFFEKRRWLDVNRSRASGARGIWMSEMLLDSRPRGSYIRGEKGKFSSFFLNSIEPKHFIFLVCKEYFGEKSCELRPQTEEKAQQLKMGKICWAYSVFEDARSACPRRPPSPPFPWPSSIPSTCPQPLEFIPNAKLTTTSPLHAKPCADPRWPSSPSAPRLPLLRARRGAHSILFRLWSASRLPSFSLSAFLHRGE